ncbi:MAG: hypothetical protein ABEJ78_02475 [Haloferacaceae archaeon]
MRKPAIGRARKLLRTLGAWLLSPLARLVDGIATGIDASTDDEPPSWGLSWAGAEESRWRRGTEFVDCTAFGDGYVVTTSFDDRDATLQLTPGPVPLGSALATVSLFCQHGVSPQFDNAGRPFVPVDGDEPRPVFDEAEDDDAVHYVYLDGIRTLEEFPDFLTVRSDVKRAFRRMAPQKPGRQR